MSIYRWWNDRNYRKFTERLMKSMKETEEGTVSYITWEEAKKRWAAKDSWRDSHPWQAKAEHAWHRAFGRYGIVRHTLHPRRLMNQSVWFWQRGRRGWADSDVWSLDSYATRVLSEMMIHLAENTHSWPGGGEGATWATPEDWDAHLLSLGKRLGAWNENSFADKEAFEVTRAAMEEFGKNLGAYWDLLGQNGHARDTGGFSMTTGCTQQDCPHVTPLTGAHCTVATCDNRRSGCPIHGGPR